MQLSNGEMASFFLLFTAMILTGLGGCQSGQKKEKPETHNDDSTVVNKKDLSALKSVIVHLPLMHLSM